MTPPRLSRKNRQIVERALRAMLRYPETYDQRDYMVHDAEARPTRKRPAPYCGTTACIAGHVALAAGYHADPVTSNWVLGRDGAWPVTHVAEKVLGRRAGYALFDAEAAGWPDKFRLPFLRATRPATKARIAVARVRHWLRTGE